MLSFLEVTGERPLKFYPGVAYGTLYPETKVKKYIFPFKSVFWLYFEDSTNLILVQFVYSSEDGARSARIKTSSGQYIYTYYNGGCAFRNHRQVLSVIFHFKFSFNFFKERLESRES